VDSIISSIECSAPVTSEGQSALIESGAAAAGAWKLLYASNGTLNHKNLVAALLHAVELIPSLGISRVSQEIYACPGRNGIMRVENSVVISLGARTGLSVPAQCFIVAGDRACLDLISFDSVDTCPRSKRVVRRGMNAKSQAWR
jgi:hypothetical protein